MSEIENQDWQKKRNEQKKSKYEEKNPKEVEYFLPIF